MELTRRQIGSTERWIVVGLVVMFSALAGAAFLKSFFDNTYHPDAALTEIALIVVGGAVTHLFVAGRNRRDNDDR